MLQNITIRSTDNGVPPLYIEESFTIYVEDINEAPSKITITGQKVSFTGTEIRAPE